MGSPPAASCSPEAEPALLALLPLRPPYLGPQRAPPYKERGKQVKGGMGGTTLGEGPPARKWCSCVFLACQ